MMETFVIYHNGKTVTRLQGETKPVLDMALSLPNILRKLAKHHPQAVLVWCHKTLSQYFYTAKIVEQNMTFYYELIRNNQ